jgi:hypothetical protein
VVLRCRSFEQLKSDFRGLEKTLAEALAVLEELSRVPDAATQVASLRQCCARMGEETDAVRAALQKVRRRRRRGCDSGCSPPTQLTRHGVHGREANALRCLTRVGALSVRSSPRTAMLCSPSTARPAEAR